MAAGQDTQVDPDDLANLGRQFGAAADTLHNGLGNGTQLTSTPAQAWGPATTVVQNYQTLAGQFLSGANDTVTSLRGTETSLQDSATNYRRIETANATRVKTATGGTR